MDQVFYKQKSTYKNNRPSIRLENIIWLKRNHERFWSTYKAIFLNSSGLTVFEKDAALLFHSLGFTSMRTGYDWQEHSFDVSGGKSLVL